MRHFDSSQEKLPHRNDRPNEFGALKRVPCWWHVSAGPRDMSLPLDPWLRLVLDEDTLFHSHNFY
jgi:hypothetical protein